MDYYLSKTPSCHALLALTQLGLARLDFLIRDSVLTNQYCRYLSVITLEKAWKLGLEWNLRFSITAAAACTGSIHVQGVT